MLAGPPLLGDGAAGAKNVMLRAGSGRIGRSAGAQARDAVYQRLLYRRRAGQQSSMQAAGQQLTMAFVEHVGGNHSPLSAVSMNVYRISVLNQRTEAHVQAFDCKRLPTVVSVRGFLTIYASNLLPLLLWMLQTQEVKCACVIRRGLQPWEKIAALGDKLSSCCYCSTKNALITCCARTASCAIITCERCGFAHCTGTSKPWVTGSGYCWSSCAVTSSSTITQLEKRSRVTPPPSCKAALASVSNAVLCKSLTHNLLVFNSRCILEEKHSATAAHQPINKDTQHTSMKPARSRLVHSKKQQHCDKCSSLEERIVVPKTCTTANHGTHRTVIPFVQAGRNSMHGVECGLSMHDACLQVHGT
ncbi:hypothetical protein COO60DRAFT_556915 [Scenedesmus sp. NREL 46B-D3]|nr:hypothetical protein COO60DRAFT_556915 [Scenedesmus sp. NREL 46B-D3]